MRKLRSLAVSVFILIVGFYGLSFFWMRAQMQGTSIPVDEVFEGLIANPIPTAVSQLQGARSDAMQGHLAFMRFQAPSLLSAGLTSPPYGPVDCAQILSRFVLPDFLKSPFSPEWAPPVSPEICLQTVDLQGGAGATNYVVYDDGWVHFHFWGG